LGITASLVNVISSDKAQDAYKTIEPLSRCLSSGLIRIQGVLHLAYALNPTVVSVAEVVQEE